MNRILAHFNGRSVGEDVRYWSKLYLPHPIDVDSPRIYSTYIKQREVVNMSKLYRGVDKSDGRESCFLVNDMGVAISSH